MPNPVAPSTNEYLELSNEAYTLNGQLSSGTTLPTFDGMTVIAQSTPLELADGFSAIAVEDASGNIIIVNEGTLLQTTTTGLIVTPVPFMTQSIAADIQISEGITQTKALTDAAAFADQVEQTATAQNNGNSVPLYVTGHSLGGIEAQAEAKELFTNPAFGPADFAGGATFGATGLPGQTTAGGPATLIDYVDQGDTVGNYALDTNTETPNPFASTNAASYHFGMVVEVGPASHATYLQNAQSNFLDAKILNSLAQMTGQGGSLADLFQLGAITDDAKAIQYHLMSVYAADLQAPETVAPAQNLPGLPYSSDWITQEEAASYGNVAISNTQDEAVEGNGTIVTPDFTTSSNSTTDQITIDQTANITTSQGVAADGGITTLTIDPDTDLVESATYKSADGSTYNATLNEATGNFQTLEVNENNGASYQVSYTYNADGSSSSVTNGYSAANLGGTLQFTETTGISASGQVSTAISGTGDDTGLSDAAITLASNGSASITGSDNTITLASNASAGITGNGNAIAEGTNAFASLTGTGNVVILAAGAGVDDSAADIATDSVTFDAANGASLTFGPGTLPPEPEYTNSGTVSYTLDTASDVSLGTLSFNTATNTDSLSLANDLTITLPGISDNVIASPPAGSTPEQALLDYLSDLGAPQTAFSLDQLNTAFFEPVPLAASLYDVTGIVEEADDYTAADVFYIPGAPGAQMSGQSTAELFPGYDVPATNFLYLDAQPDFANGFDASTDLTNDSITDIPYLLTNGQNVSMTNLEFNGFSYITEGGTITATTAGTYDLAGANVDQSSAFDLTAANYNNPALSPRLAS